MLPSVKAQGYFLKQLSCTNLLLLDRLAYNRRPLQRMLITIA